MSVPHKIVTRSPSGYSQTKMYQTGEAFDRWWAYRAKHLQPGDRMEGFRFEESAWVLVEARTANRLGR